MRHQIVEINVRKACNLAIYRDPLTTADGCRKIITAGHRNQFVEIIISITDVFVETVDTVGNNADATHRGALLVEGESTGIGGESKRCTERACTGAAAGTAEAIVQIRAGQVAELHAEQRTGRLPGFTRVKTFLHDLARGAGAEGISL